MREQAVATLEPDSPAAEWMLSFSRGTHVCPQPRRPRLISHGDELCTRAGELIESGAPGFAVEFVVAAKVEEA
ncbi:hypothetical protein GCM10010515_67760 [Streptomyces fructofermentans]|uniref:Uncharacterized protein n=1 Tax=Streptomyces fructofermentans TaxID=152141 RepID=A0A918NRV1_9ACTN|nr:hypothetical protein GCM10010515_67760 [Streptomyces fructofermentans]